MKPSFFTELQRRNVLRAGAFYASVAWLLVQIATQVAPYIDVPNTVVRVVIVAAAIGFSMVRSGLGLAVQRPQVPHAGRPGHGAGGAGRDAAVTDVRQGVRA